MSTALPDVNVLIALVFEAHQFHEEAQQWFRAQRDRGWATCAVTQNGFIRVASNPRLHRRVLSPREAVGTLEQLTGAGKHAFEPLHPSCLGEEFRQLVPRLQGYRQVTDAWLLAMAEHRGLQLVTLDRRLADLSPFRSKPVVLAA